MAEILRASNVVFRGNIHYPEIVIPAGETTFIQGVSGCGKSTLLRLFNATASPDSGELFFHGENINGMETIQLRREILLVGQSVYLFMGTIEDNFREYYTYRGQNPPSEDEMNFFLALCCVDFPIDAVCDNMSGGEKQRIFIAVCLSFSPKVLLLDEPTSALDRETSTRLIGQVKLYCTENGITLLAVSHDTALVELFADHVILLGKGDANERCD